jgi:3'-phosphoadenosine 5'-phosphosulfate sulfotransferase (PAPS reductase)/FAD synthetase
MIVRAKKTFFDMVRHRGMWPSPKYRQCTSDLKRAPIEKAIRHYSKAIGNKLIVDCIGKRAEESPARAKERIFGFDRKNSKAGREWYKWLPIHEWKIGKVFAKIADAGERPHWAYSQGMTRLSCCFCIMASKQDLKIAAGLQSVLFKEYCDLEKEIGHTLIMPSKKNGKLYLDEVISCF